MSNLVVAVVGWLLRRSNLSLGARNKLVIHILASLSALPLGAIIETNDNGELTINKKPLDMEQGKMLQAHALSALDNKALNLIREQVAYVAVTGSVHKAVTPEDLYFYRAALWWGQQVEHHLKLLAQREEPTL